MNKMKTWEYAAGAAMFFVMDVLLFWGYTGVWPWQVM